MSPLSWFAVYIFGLHFILILHPSLLELLVFCLVDGGAVLATKIVDRRLFVWLHPDSYPYFTPDKLPKGKLTLEQKTALFESMRCFPARRALYCLFISIPKTIPGSLIAVFYWKHTITNLSQLLLVIAIGTVIWSYFYAAVFMESHILVSRKIAEYHGIYDWADVFRQATVPYDRREFDRHETMGLVSIWIFMMVLQWLVITRTPSPGTGRFNLALMESSIGAAGLILIMRIWYLGKQYFVGGLREIFQTLESMDPEVSQKILPLHSDRILAHFEKIVNGLVERLRSYRQELSRWVFYQTEESRYRALGELSALIVHDLSAPLHVIHFCTEQVKENPDILRNPRYIDQLTVNGARSLELISSLKAYLKDGKFKSAGVAFAEAHQRVIRLLETQFHTQGFSKVQINTEPNALPIKVDVPKADLIHVLMNLYGNSLLNLLENSIPEPKIQVTMVELTEQQVTYSIADNGTGLSAKRFEELTAFSFLPDAQNSSRDGLGLRLVRRLVERNRGSLFAVDPGPGESGSRFHLTLKRQTTLDQAEEQNGKTTIAKANMGD